MGNTNNIYRVWDLLQVLLQNSPFDLVDAHFSQGPDATGIQLQLVIENKHLLQAGAELQKIAEQSGMVASVAEIEHENAIADKNAQQALKLLEQMQNGNTDGLISEMMEESDGATALNVELEPVTVSNPTPVVRRKQPQPKEQEGKIEPKKVQAERRAAPMPVLDADQINQMFTFGQEK